MRKVNPRQEAEAYRRRRAPSMYAWQGSGCGTYRECEVLEAIERAWLAGYRRARLAQRQGTAP